MLGAMSFKRTMSLSGVFKRRREAGYKSWEGEDEEGLITESSPFVAAPRKTLESPIESEEEAEVFVDGEASIFSSADGMRLVDCFYLGSYNVAGLDVMGRGCIDSPAGQIWARTQERKPKRKNSLPARLPATSERMESSDRPRYVNLVAAKNHLRVFDDRTNELVAEFSYKKISFVGTHPKHTQLFAFIGEPQGDATPFCFAFKCESTNSAYKAANSLSKVFQERIKQLKTQIEIRAATTTMLLISN